MILQRAYHKLQEWIIMLDSPDFKDNDAGLVREEMIRFAGEIWLNRNAENIQTNCPLGETAPDFGINTKSELNEKEKGL